MVTTSTILNLEIKTPLFVRDREMVRGVGESHIQFTWGETIERYSKTLQLPRIKLCIHAENLKIMSDTKIKFNGSLEFFVFFFTFYFANKFLDL